VSDDGRGLKFGTVAELYDLYRPSPPDEAHELAGDLAGLEVLEVGAGTGKLTRFLLALGARMTVIEPDEEMLKVLVRQSPEVTVLKGRAESVPVADATFDVAFSSSAWHWFTQPDATREMARVLRDDGRLHVWWNGFSRDVPWMVALTELRQPVDERGARPRGWRANLDVTDDFVDIEDFSLDWTWTRTTDQVVGNFSTYSGVIIQSDEQQRARAHQVRAFVEDLFPDGVVELPMTLRGTFARRRPRVQPK